MGTALLEICAGSWDSVLAAHRGGAARVELCSALSEGGLTPSAGLVAAACRLSGLRVHVLIRPRPGDFLYTDAEADIMADDVRRAVGLGADGVVIGGLTPEGDIDTRLTRRLAEAAAGRSVTFHRAFDLCRRPDRALECLVDCGCHRLLSSGQAPTAEQVLPLLRAFVGHAGDRLVVMPGSGVNAGNAARILRESGAHEIHASARRPVGSRMMFRNEGVNMGAPTDEYVRLETDADEVRALLRAIG